jgi:hypothetical protein
LRRSKSESGNAETPMKSRIRKARRKRKLEETSADSVCKLERLLRMLNFSMLISRSIAVVNKFTSSDLLIVHEKKYSKCM